MIAHQMYSIDHKFAVMPGYAKVGDVKVWDDAGRRLGGIRGRRYPWRILPYTDFELGTMYRASERLLRTANNQGYVYNVSLAPRFGLNVAFVGGNASDAGDPAAAAFYGPNIDTQLTNLWGSNWYIKRSSKVPSPSMQLVFASAFEPLNRLDGFHKVLPPNFTERIWATSQPREEEVESGLEVGYVSFRFHGKVAAVMFDGHTELLGWQEMQDMRRWSPLAKTEDYVLPSP